MARQVLDVFLSSTGLDLQPHRTAIHAELTNTGIFLCVRQEDFGAQDAGAVEFCRDKVRASDIFLGLVGHRRGWEPKGDDAERSITEMEHDWAKEYSRARFLYVAPDDFPVPANLRDTDAQYARQHKFRQRVMEGGERIVSQKDFENPEQFAAKVVSRLILQTVARRLEALSPQLSLSADEHRPDLAAAVNRLAEDEDVDLIAIAKDPKSFDFVDLESKLKMHAEKHEAAGRASLRISSQYWRHIGAIAFVHNTRKALAAYQRAVILDPTEPVGWRFLGELQYRQSQLARAEQSFNRVLELGKSAQNLTTQAIGLLHLGWICIDRDELNKAESLISKAAELAELDKWQEGVARAYCNLGIVYQIRGELDKADNMQMRALAIEEELASKEGIARVYSNLCRINEVREDFAKAEEMARRALAIYKELNHQAGMASAYSSLGNIYHIRGNLREAENLYLRGLKLHKQLDDRDGMAAIFSNLGAIYERQEEFDKAEKSLLKAAAIFRELDNGKRNLADTYLNLGNTYLKMENKSEACKCWHRAQLLYGDAKLPEDAKIAGQLRQQNGCKEEVVEIKGNAPSTGRVN